ncbi:MAG: hypothetical protein IGR93_18460 [Hydrococcus sp. C42_A2020_068]|nr:hypothetical protein [Hydrococcus sp. C42_A2020_068]
MRLTLGCRVAGDVTPLRSATRPNPTVLGVDAKGTRSQMTEMVDCPHPQPLSQFGRGEKDVDRD